MKIINQFWVLSLSLILLLSGSPAWATVSAFKVGSAGYTVDGVNFAMDVAPYIQNGRTLVPLRYAAYASGVKPDNILFANNKVTLIKGDKVVQLTIGSNVMRINGVSIVMDITPVVINGRTMLPLRWVAQALGVEVTYNAHDQSILLTDSAGTSQLVNPPPVVQPQPQPQQTTVTMNLFYKWYYRGYEFTWSVPITEEQYTQTLNFYRAKPHPGFSSSFPILYTNTYTLDPSDDKEIASIVAALKASAQKYGFDQYATVEFVIAFVQSFKYVSDSASAGFDDYPRYPLETLLQQGGDCEDTAILTAVLLRELGFGTALIFVPAPNINHCAVGVLGGEGVFGSYYTSGNKKYFYLETTASGWPIGVVPQEYVNASAYVVPLL